MPDPLATLGTTTYYGYQIGNLADADFAHDNRTTDVIWVGGDYNFTPAFNLAVGFYDINQKASDEAVPTQKAGNIYEYSLLADYHFSKRTDAYAGLMYSQYKGDAYPSSGTEADNTSNYIFAVGMRTKF